jgi:hypothetical protein
VDASLEHAPLDERADEPIRAVQLEQDVRADVAAPRHVEMLRRADG